MPQLDPEFFLSQVFWLVIIFALIYLFISKVFLPRIGSTVELRAKKIADDIATSEQMIAAYKILEIEALESLKQARLEGFRLVEEATKKAERQLNARLEAINSNLNTQSAKHEEILARFKSRLRKNLKVIANDLKEHIVNHVLNT